MIKFVDLHLLSTEKGTIVRVNDIKEVYNDDHKTIVRMIDGTQYDCHPYDYKRLRSWLMEEDE